jgi:hypothetical protein
VAQPAPHAGSRRGGEKPGDRCQGKHGESFHRGVPTGCLESRVWLNVAVIPLIVPRARTIGRSLAS